MKVLRAIILTFTYPLDTTEMKRLSGYAYTKFNLFLCILLTVIMVLYASID